MWEKWFRRSSLIQESQFFNFAADVTGDEPRFDYRLREGVSEQRLGMTLLRQEGVLDRLERSAKLDNLDRAHYPANAD